MGWQHNSKNPAAFRGFTIRQSGKRGRDASVAVVASAKIGIGAQSFSQHSFWVGKVRSQAPELFYA